jgi:hypothetical protein
MKRIVLATTIFLSVFVSVPAHAQLDSLKGAAFAVPLDQKVFEDAYKNCNKEMPLSDVYRDLGFIEEEKGSERGICFFKTNQYASNFNQGLLFRIECFNLKGESLGYVYREVKAYRPKRLDPDQIDIPLGLNTNVGGPKEVSYVKIEMVTNLMQSGKRFLFKKEIHPSAWRY